MYKCYNPTNGAPSISLKRSHCDYFKRLYLLVTCFMYTSLNTIDGIHYIHPKIITQTLMFGSTFDQPLPSPPQVHHPHLDR